MAKEPTLERHRVRDDAPAAMVFVHGFSGEAQKTQASVGPRDLDELRERVAAAVAAGRHDRVGGCSSMT